MCGEFMHLWVEVIIVSNQVRYDSPQKPLIQILNCPPKICLEKDADQRNGSTGSHQKKGGVTSYVSVVNGVTPLVQPGNSLSSAPALVLDKELLVSIGNTVYTLIKEISADPFGLNDLLGLKKPVEENLEPSPRCHTPGVLAWGSVLGVLDEMIRVGRAMGYSMEGCEKDIESIINSKGDEAVLR
ncbi:hypothetical protein Tco_0667172 [Tanacetum coccineum]